MNPKLLYNNLIITFITWLLVIFTLNGQDKILRFNHLTTDEGLPQNTIYGIEKDNYGFMWFGTWGGLGKFDGYHFKVYTFDRNNLKTIPNNKIISVRKDRAGNIWIMTIDSLFARYNYNTDDFKRFNKKELPEAFVKFMDKSINQSHTKIITPNYEWKGGTNVFIQTNRITHQETKYFANIFDKWAIHINNAPWFYFDNNEILWVGTYYNGICFADVNQKPFNYLRNIQLEKDKQPILDNKVRAICKDHSGNLWVGTSEEGISKYNLKTGHSEHFQYNFNEKFRGQINFLLNHIRAIYCDKNGDIWIGSGAGVRKYNSLTGKTTYYWLNAGEKGINFQVRSIIEDMKGNLWICSRDFIARYNKKTDQFDSVNPLINTKIINPKFRILLCDKKGNFWISSEVAGLIKMNWNKTDSTKFSTTIYHYSKTDSNTIGDSCIYHIHEDKDGNIWAATNSGITRYDPFQNKFTRITMQNGLPDNYILSVVSDNRGIIWASHKKGLSQINPANMVIKNYTVDDGLLSNEFMENACYSDTTTNQLYFGSLNGLIYFNPLEMKDNPYPPKLVFTNLQLNNQNISYNQFYNGRIIYNKPLYLTNEIVLTYKETSFSLEFAALQYSNPLKNKYKYKLEGFDKEWIETDASNRFAKYSNLKPQTYILRVIASNNDGIWNETGISMKIIVYPAWWNTWLFRISIVFILSIALYLLYRLRISQLTKRQNELSILVKKRTQELEDTNKNLIESQARIEEYTEEVLQQRENLKVSNDQLLENQKLIEKQTEILQHNNIELKKLNVTKDKLMSIIAHDLKNPFHTVIGFSGLLLAKFDTLPPEKIKHYISLINSISSGGYDLLENLLQWSRSQTGSIAFEPVILKPAVIAQDVLNLFSGSAQAKNIIFQQFIDENTEITADENMLRTIFRNLISNALKFTNDQGTISTNLIYTDQTAKITVSDTGIGISPQTIDLLFKLDSPLTTRGTSNESGTGLGLLLCKEFIEMHGGKIGVESKIGKGSTFWFTLPLTKTGNR